MASTLIRTAIVYALLTATLRLMGKRQLGELDIGDLVSTLLISELAAIPIDDPDIPLLNAIIPICFIFALEIILSTIKNKSKTLKTVLDGAACFIIYKGRLSQRALTENRLSINELLASLRSAGVGDISDVEYAILEQNGTISVLEKGKSTLAHAVIIDGELTSDVSCAPIPEKEILAKLKKANIKKDEVFLMTLDDSGKIEIIKKESHGKNDSGDKKE